MLTKEMNRDVSCTVIAKKVAQHECKEPDDFYDGMSPFFEVIPFENFSLYYYPRRKRFSAVVS